jgi:tripartite-type tricarboxylate transporter receptor subunit TctC
VLTPRSVLGQARYPDRAIRLVIPFAAGGVADRIGRLWADRIKSLLGPVVLENQGGAGGLVGAAAVARAHPDGTTILLGSVGAQVLLQITATQASSDPARDLEPVSILAITALTITVHPAPPIADLAQFVAHARANPGALSYGSAGTGTMPHLAGELFKSLARTPDIVHVPYRGGSQAMADLISGHIPMIVTSVSTQLMDLHQAGKVKVLAVTTVERAAIAPQIPTARESGLPDMIAQNSFGSCRRRRHGPSLGRSRRPPTPPWRIRICAASWPIPASSPLRIPVPRRRAVSSMTRRRDGRLSSRRSG